ncbi:MAG: hypothetical protein COB02_18490 [Candidatus Cloacimonadota bacterium]|nr:MAG: hypothetical protein COB02_18490 [Candidatus Cloacimonadota bacterium]
MKLFLFLILISISFPFVLNDSIHSIRNLFFTSTFNNKSNFHFNGAFRNVFNVSINDNVDFNIHLNHQYFNKSLLTNNLNRFEQFSHHLYQNQHLISKIDRFQFNFSHKQVDFVLGRQAISFGTSHFISVMDIINPFAPGTIDSSYKSGIDALRIQKATGDTGEIEFIFSPNESNKDNAYFFRSRQLIKNIDYEFLIGRFRQHNMIAFAFEGEIKKQSIWGESSFIQFDNNPFDFNNHQSYNLSFNIGLDFHPHEFENISISWFHQQSGAKNPQDFTRVLSNPSFKEQFSYLKGKNYFNLNYQRKIKALVDIGLSFIYNINDYSIFFQPKLSINTSNNSDLVIFYSVGIGSQTSDFGSFSNTIGIFSQYYF